MRNDDERIDDDSVDDEDESLDDDELITLKEACRLLTGNTKPMHVASYYRGAARGDYPPPVHPSPGISRVSKKKVLKARARIIETGA